MTTAAPVRRDFLERISRPLLVRLVEPFAPLLRERGLPLETIASSEQDDRKPPRKLFSLLLDESAGPSLEELVARLASVAKLANARGRDSLVSVDRERLLPMRLGAEDLAVTAFLDFPKLFEQARGGAAPEAVKGFVVYSAKGGRTAALEESNVEAVRAHLSVFFESRHRTSFCDILVTRRGPEHHFEIMHGQAPATHDLIDPELRANVVTQVSAQRSYAIYHEEDQLLSVHAVEFLKEPLRASFSHGLAGDASHFARAESLLDLSRLSDLSSALAPEPELGITLVELRALSLLMRDGSTASFAGGTTDIRRTMQNELIQHALTQLEATPIELKMAVSLQLEGAPARRPLLVTIRGLRNQLDYDRRDPRAEAALLSWLSLRGIWNGTRPESPSILAAGGRAGG